LTSDPLSTSEDPFLQAAHALAERIAKYGTVQVDDEYRAQWTYMLRLTRDFVVGVRSAAVAFTRYTESKKWLLQSSMDDFLESAISLVSLAQQGVFNVGRRELRYMVELAVKCVYVDQICPTHAALAQRVELAGDSAQVPRSSVEVVDRLTLRMLPNPIDFMESVRSTFGSLSRYTHPSKDQLEERFRRVDRGEFSGFESARTLRAFNRHVGAAYDHILVLIFEGIGPTFTGELFMQIFDHDSAWKFHKGHYVRQVSAHFDYKSERQGYRNQSRPAQE
jgi:hypothetical protein